MRRASIDTSKPWVTAKCPCGGQYTAGSLVDEPGQEPGLSAVLHTLPSCAPYNELDPLDFLDHARQNGSIAIDAGGLIVPQGHGASSVVPFFPSGEKPS